MPRNGAGNFTLVAGNPVVSGTEIQSTWANQTLADVADALTNSLARNGEGGMTAPLRLVDGVETTPGLAFANETSTGVYRAASGDVGVSVLGSRVVRVRTTGVDVTGNLNATGTLGVTGAATVGGTLGVTGNVAVNTNKFTVDAETGDTAVAGTLGVAGATSLANLSYSGTLTGGTGVINIGSGQIYKDASGNVGIGTSAPSVKLDVAIATGGLVQQLTGTSGVYTRLGTASSSFYTVHNGTTDTYLYTQESAALRFGTAATERMRIDPSGNLLVATTTAIIHNTTTRGFIYEPVKWLSLNSQNEALLLTTQTAGAVQRFYLQNTGDKGSIAISSGGTAYNTTSDYRLKENVTPIKGALERVLGYRPVTYTWKADGSVGRGYIAHWLQEDGGEGAVTGEKDAMRIEQYEISPAIPAVIGDDGEVIKPAVEAVMGEREVPAYQGIDTSFLVADLNGAIKEMHEIIVQLRAEVDALKGATA